MCSGYVALAQDLRVIADSGARIAALHDIARAVAEPDFSFGRDRTVVGLSFDDGPRFDLDDFEHPRFGFQRSFANILRDFTQSSEGSRQKTVHATSFVIASAEARQAMAIAPDCGHADVPGWLDDGWWGRADAEGLIAVENHSWDHVHHAVRGIDPRQPADFATVHTFDEAERQIHRSSRYIASMTGRTPTLFAFPFGTVNDYDYVTGVYLPHRGREIGLKAAFTTGGRPVSIGRVWSIPRYVCDDHWRHPDGLRAIIAAA